MTNQTLNYILLCSPLLIGGLIAAFNSEEVNNSTEKVEAWTRRTQANVSIKKNWFSSYIANPVLWLIVKFSDWTDDFAHRGLKNGIRVAATTYLIGIWCYLIFAALVIVLAIAFGILVLYIIFSVMGSSDNTTSQSFERGRRIVGPVGKGERINQDTGRVEKDGFFGYSDTDRKIDPETGKIQKDGFFGMKDTETRIDQETGNFQKEGFFGYHDTDSRIDPETGIIQTKGVFGWVDTEERVNPETGKHQKNGVFGWSDTV
jgi:hypothetical protein